jgi:2-keto-4-pentenoate hydratase
MIMTEKANEAAKLLLDARRSGKLIAALPDALAPRSLDESYAIQHAVIAGLGSRIAGYKISIFPDGSHAVAPILADLIIGDGASKRLAPASRIAIELEFGFRFGVPVAADASAAQVLDAIESTVVTIELCDSRYDTIDGKSKEVLVADMISNCGAVAGTAHRFDASKPFKTATCRQLFDGKVDKDRTGSHPNGDPLLPLPLVPKALAAAGYSLGGGQFVITGSLTGITWVKAPLVVEGQIDGFGKARVTLSA